MVERGKTLAKAVPLLELHRQLTKMVSWTAFYARRAVWEGVWFAATVELAWLENAVHLTIHYRVQRSDADEKATKKVLERKVRVVDKLLDLVKRRLKEEGIEIETAKRVITSFGETPDFAIVEVTVKPTKVDWQRLLSRKGRRWRILFDSATYYGGVGASELKALESEVVEEHERGGKAGSVEEAVGAAAEGGGEEAAVVTGSDLVGHREAAERGYLRAHQATLRYGVPLLLLLKLAVEGRIRSLAGIDEKGKPAVYVLEEDVKEVAKYLRLERKEGEQGGGDGG